MANILILTSHYPPPPGGIQTVTRNLERGLENTHHTVRVEYIPANQEHDWYDYLPSLDYLKVRPSAYPLLNHIKRQSREAIQEFNPDVVHATHIRMLPSLQVASEFGIPSVLSTYALELKHKKLARAAFREATIVHAISDFTRQLVTEFDSSTDIRIIPPSIDIEQYRNIAKSSKKSRDVMAMARFVDRKNLQTIIDAWKKLSAEVKDGRKLNIVGDGPNRERLINQAGEADDITFTGFVDEQQKVKMLAESELFTLVPLREGYDVEGFGIVWIEAQAAGTPVIGSSFGGATEAIGDGGMIVETPHDSSAVADAIETMLTSSDQDKYLSAATDRITQFSIQHVTAEFDSLYRGLIE